jgi:hypothetical protein
MASAMPVLPEVGSTRVVLPGAMSPRASASAIIARPMRSFTELHGSMLSSLATISAPESAPILFSRTMGVPPMSCVMSSAIFGAVSAIIRVASKGRRLGATPPRNACAPGAAAEKTAARRRDERMMRRRLIWIRPAPSCRSSRK